MSERSEIESALHRMRSTLMRLKLEVELSPLLSHGDAQRLLATIDELSGLESVIHQRLPKGLNVIVIEDDDELGDLIVAGLRREGHDAVNVADIDHASRVASENSMLVLDLSVIEDAPVSAIHWLRTRRPIILTGAAPLRAQDVAAVVDARAVLMKPVTSAALVDALAHVAEAIPE